MGKVSVTGKEPQVTQEFSIKSRVGIIGTRYGGSTGGLITGGNPLGALVISLALIATSSRVDDPFTNIRIGSTSNDLKTNEDKVLQDVVLPSIDQELVQQSKGVFEYIPIRQLKLNHEKQDHDFVKRLIQENQLDVVLLFHQNAMFSWHNDVRIWENISVYDHTQQHLATIQIFIDGNLHGGAHPHVPWVPDDDEVMIEVKEVATTWDKQAYYRLFAKKTVGYLIKYFKEGPYELKGMGYIKEEERPPLIPVK